MKIPDNYVKELTQYIAGDAATNLVFLIKDKSNVSEFKIAEKLDITVNQTRNILYKLQDKNLVFFTRKKDKKKGWYIYYWTFDKPRARDLILDLKIIKQQKLRKILRDEKQGNVYACPNKDIRVDAETALEYQFKCPECDSVLIEEDVKKRSDKIKGELDKLKLEIEEVSKIQKPLPKPEPVKKPARKQKKAVKKKPIRKVAKKRTVKKKTPRKKKPKKPRPKRAKGRPARKKPTNKKKYYRN